MKKLLLILFLFFSLQSFAQFPTNTTTGTPNSTVLTRGVSAADSAYWYRTNFTDTTTANYGRLDELPGAIIRTGDILWRRNNAATAWIREGVVANTTCGLFSGGGGYVTWDSLLIFSIAPAEYQLCCENKVRNSSLTHKTLAAADPSLNRFDMIALDSTGVVVVTGTAAANPAQPQPTDCQIPLTYIYIPAGSTVPGNGGSGTPTQTVIYDETGGSEWTPAASGVTINFSNTSFPYHLVKAADAGAFSASQSFTFTKGSGTITLSDYTTLKFYIRLKSAFSPQAKFGLVFQNSTSSQASRSTVMQSGSFNFVRTTVGSYQEITIPISEFLGGQTTVVDRLYFLFLNTGNSDGFYIDWIQLQSGVTQPPTTGGGTLTSISVSGLSPLFTTSVLNPTTTPQVTFSQISQTQNKVFASPNGSTGVPTFRALAVNDFNSGTGASSSTFWRGDGTWATAGTTYTASELITLSGSDFQFGGTATSDRTATMGANTLTITGNTVADDPILSITSTSTAAASNLQKGINVSLSGANSTSTQTTYGADFSNTHTGASSTNIGARFVASGGTNNFAILVPPSSGTVSIGSNNPGSNSRLIVTGAGDAYAFEANNTSNTAIYGNTTNGNAIAAQTTGTGAVVNIVGIPSSTNDVSVVGLFSRQTSGTAANNIGGSLDFYVETDNGNNRIANQFIWKLTTAADATRTSQFIITGVNSAVTADLFTLSGSGATRLNKYGVGTFTSGTPTYTLQVDASGNLMEGSVISGSGVTESFYTPTLTNTTNIAASTAYTTYYIRSGNWVYVWGVVDIDATTASSVCEMGMSLPVGSGVATVGEVAGTGGFEDNTVAQIKGDVGNSRAVWRFTPQTNTNNKYSFHFSYTIQN